MRTLLGMGVTNIRASKTGLGSIRGAQRSLSRMILVLMMIVTVMLGVGVVGTGTVSCALASVGRNVHGLAMEDVSTWAEHQKQVALTRMLMNISRPDAAPGSVVASPSKSDPNYYYHWVRDAALTMDVLVSEAGGNVTPAVKNYLEKTLFDYVDFSRQNQLTQTLTGLGEPKFYVDGSAFNDPWGRPQNDGPALRAITLTHFAYLLMKEGKIDYVRQTLYDGQFPTSSVIKADLEYVSHHWQDPSFDPWEEVRGDHFYDRMVQRRALIEGSNLARILGDTGAADWYSQQAKAIEQDLKRFIDTDQQIIIPTLNRVEGIDYKDSNLDIAVILGVLHGDAGDGFLPASSPIVLNTASKLIDAFRSLYRVNQLPNVPGVAIGRYPEDRYGGGNFNGGNPWLLATAAMGQLYYRASRELTSRDPALAQSLHDQADQFLERIQYHANPDGSMSEQWDRNTGFMTSARDLTWSYASFLSLMAEREGWSQ